MNHTSHTWRRSILKVDLKRSAPTRMGRTLLVFFRFVGCHARSPKTGFRARADDICDGFEVAWDREQVQFTKPTHTQRDQTRPKMYACVRGPLVGNATRRQASR